jgi:Ca-activated chloride channel homolog
MASVQALGLNPLRDADIALESVSVTAVLHGLLVEATVEQRYRNLEAIPIEAVYTFPLPLGAVLLELIFERSGKTLRGVVQPRAKAQEGYEEAIDEGDTAVLLEQAGSGLYTTNVGNLLAGDDVLVRIRYAQLLFWQGGSLRFWLPTTIAPRYGDASAAGLQDYQEPTYALAADVQFAITVTIEGPLARAPFECPSHPMAVVDSEGHRILRLSGATVPMDRDFVLVLREPDQWSPAALVAPDGPRTVVMASFHPQLTALNHPRQRKLTVLVDCSGSMAGDSITQARTALREILDSLGAEDQFNVIAFGSTRAALFPGIVPVDARSLARAQGFLESLDANLGGTELGAALDAAYRQPGASDVLLITDGEVWDDGALVNAARSSGCRLFTVGVGHAVAEGLLNELAQATDGALELVSPREDMAERIVRHFHRMDQPRAERVEVRWPTDPIRQMPSALARIYSGDTVHVFGLFNEAPAGRVTLEVQFPDGQHFQEAVDCPSRAAGDGVGAADTLARLAAHQRLAELDAAEACGLAVEYQLVTEHTACLLVETREDADKVDVLPAIRKVPSTLAAGWGGLGSLTSLRDAFLEPGVRSIATGIDAVSVRPRGSFFSIGCAPPLPSAECVDPPAPASVSSGLRDEVPLSGTDHAIDRFLRRLNAKLSARYFGYRGPDDFSREDWLALLDADPRPAVLVRAFDDAAAIGATHESAGLAFLAALLEVQPSLPILREVKRMCRRLLRSVPLDDEVIEIFRNALLGGAPSVADSDIE